MKPGIPKGTRDFLPQQVLKRKYIFQTIEAVFKTYGYIPIETPAMENLSTLTGKYGEEGDRLLFKLLNNGDFLAKANEEALTQRDSQKLISSISKRGLRYDLTVPFARYVVMHQNDLQFPFKRYQIQPVWRADRPQKGRYQEFYQCDVDVVGSDSLMYEAELMKIFDDVFTDLKLPVKIKINNRKVLYGIAEAAGIEDKFVDMTIAMDKLDKIGVDGVVGELNKRDINSSSTEQILKLLEVQSLSELDNAFQNCTVGKEGIQELRDFHSFADMSTFSNKLKFDISLARGLNYYTGCIFEVEALNVEIGSIGGGGRYDDLTGNFGMKGVSGVGISFGAARIYDVMEELNLFPDEIVQQSKLLLVSFDEKCHKYAYQQIVELRKQSVSSELYPEPVKMKKQMKYANDRGFAFVGIIGDEEMKSNTIMLKNMITGEQEQLNLQDIIKTITND